MAHYNATRTGPATPHRKFDTQDRKFNTPERKINTPEWI
jgi:hypothetical protein